MRDVSCHAPSAGAQASITIPQKRGRRAIHKSRNLTRTIAYQSSCSPSSQSESVELSGGHSALADGEDAWEAFIPATVCCGAVLAGVRFDCCDAANVGCQTSGMDQGIGWASEILNAEVHAEVTGCGSENQGLRLPFAGLQSDSGVAEFAGKLETCQVD